MKMRWVMRKQILENIGSYHSDKVGYGALDIERTKLTWILLEWKLKVIKKWHVFVSFPGLLDMSI